MGDDDSRWHKLNFDKKQTKLIIDLYYNKFSIHKNIVMLIIFISLILGLYYKYNNISYNMIICFVIFIISWIYMCILENNISILDVSQTYYLYGVVDKIQNKFVFINNIKCQLLIYDITVNDTCVVIKYKSKYYAIPMKKFKES